MGPGRERFVHAVARRHGEEVAGKRAAVRHAEGDVGGAAGGVDLELGAQAVHQAHDLHAGLRARNEAVFDAADALGVPVLSTVGVQRGPSPHLFL